MRFALSTPTPHFTSCQLDQALSKCIASFQKGKRAKMLRKYVLFISKTSRYSFCACGRNILKIVTFVIRKGARVHRLFYMYSLNVPSVPSPYFNKIKRTSHLGKWPVLSLEILYISYFFA